MSVNEALSKVEYVDLIRALHDKLRQDANHVLNQGLEMTNLILILDLAMKEVGKIKNLIGLEKRALVVAVTKKFLNERLSEVNQSLETLGDQVDATAEQLTEEMKELVQLANSSLDSFVDQLYQLAPEAYGKTKSKCKTFWTCGRN